MGYPMTYKRVVKRNRLEGDYTHQPQEFPGHSFIGGDLRRLETDQRDEWHLSEYARRADITVEQAKAVLDAFFAGEF